MTSEVVFDGLDMTPETKEVLVQQIKHFFQHYKDLEPGKSASVGDWATLDVAHERIMQAIKRKK